MVADVFRDKRKDNGSDPKAVVGELLETDTLTRAEFDDLLLKIDSGLRALPATAQVWFRFLIGTVFKVRLLLCAFFPIEVIMII